MSHPPINSNSGSRPQARNTDVHVHLLGAVDYDRCLQLQRRLAYECDYADKPRITVLLCEHPPLVTVGRSGSWSQIRLDIEQLRRQRLEVRWVSRDGGCILHGPGQLAVYAVAPVGDIGWTRSEYNLRFLRAMESALHGMNIRNHSDLSSGTLRGRSGHLAALGIECRRNVVWHGAHLNVNPPMQNYRLIDVAPAGLGGKTTMGSLLSECGRAVRMAEVRAAVVDKLSAAFGCQQYFLQTGHPYLAPPRGGFREPVARAA